MTVQIQGQEINDQNSDYIGDGAYAFIDCAKRLWVFTYDGNKILDKICLENDVFESLNRFYKHRILNSDSDLMAKNEGMNHEIGC